MLLTGFIVICALIKHGRTILCYAVQSSFLAGGRQVLSCAMCPHMLHNTRWGLHNLRRGCAIKYAGLRNVPGRPKALAQLLTECTSVMDTPGAQRAVNALALGAHAIP